MDAKELIEKLKADLTCSICLGYFTEPVTGDCGHSFCKGCLLQAREGAQEPWTCPLCGKITTVSSDLVITRNLQKLAITAKKLRPHLLHTIVGLTTCDQHGKQEKLFCVEDHRTLCDFCTLAPQHKDHQILPLEKAAGMGQGK